MPKSLKKIVINTSPLLAIIAACDGNIDFLNKLYQDIIVPKEVSTEVNEGTNRFGQKEFKQSTCLTIKPKTCDIDHYLTSALDLGEASVIATAKKLNIQTVCIDELAGRRVARLNGLLVTGSLGILLKAKQAGLISNLKTCINKMSNQGIRLSEKLINTVLIEAGEKQKQAGLLNSFKIPVRRS